jgi:hypothetical protein
MKMKRILLSCVLLLASMSIYATPETLTLNPPLNNKIFAASGSIVGTGLIDSYILECPLATSTGIRIVPAVTLLDLNSAYVPTNLSVSVSGSLGKFSTIRTTGYSTLASAAVTTSGTAIVTVSKTGADVLYSLVFKCKTNPTAAQIAAGAIAGTLTALELMPANNGTPIDKTKGHVLTQFKQDSAE